jgi:hypothetical protein
MYPNPCAPFGKAKSYGHFIKKQAFMSSFDFSFKQNARNLNLYHETPKFFSEEK